MSASSAPRFSGAVRMRSSVTSVLMLASSVTALSISSSSGSAAIRFSTPSAEAAMPETSEGALGSIG